LSYSEIDEEKEIEEAVELAEGQSAGATRNGLVVTEGPSGLIENNNRWKPGTLNLKRLNQKIRKKKVRLSIRRIGDKKKKDTKPQEKEKKRRPSIGVPVECKEGKEIG